MSDSLILSPVEVAELTGAQRRNGQLEWMLEHGIPAEVGRDGKVKVLRAAVNAKMMPAGTRSRPKTEPNLAVYRKAS